MISIHRNAKTKKLEVMITSGNGVSYIKTDQANSEEHLKQMIGGAAQTLSPSSPTAWDDAVQECECLWEVLRKLSKERKRRVENIRPDSLPENEGFEFLYFTLIAGGVITFHEIFWLDWYMRKNKLCLTS